MLQETDLTNNPYAVDDHQLLLVTNHQYQFGLQVIVLTKLYSHYQFPLVVISVNPPSKNHLAINRQVLQVFFLQDFLDLALNLAYILQVLL